MRATRAYIASAGTASVMLGAALAMLLLVSAFVAFGSWPGEAAGKQIDQLLLNEVQKPKTEKVAVGTDAIKANRKAAIRQRVALAREERRRATRGGGGGSERPGADPVTRTPAGTAPTSAAGTPLPSAPGDTGNTVRQQTQNVTQDVQDTTKNLTQQVTSPVQQQVDETTTQVGEVVDQVVGGVQEQTSTTVQQVQDTVDTTTDKVGSTTGTVTDTVKGTVGGVLGK